MRQALPILIILVIFVFFERRPHGTVGSAPSECCSQRSGAVREDDANTLRRAAHALKGNSANLGAEAVAELARMVEGLGASGQTDPADNQLTEIEDLYQRTVVALTAWMQAA